MNQEDSRPLDDVELARLVHDVADEWSMPPLRLDQPGWRERTRRPAGRRTFPVSGWLRRLASAAAVALVLTVAVALVGVWLTLPRAPGVGKPDPSSTPSAGATQEPGDSATPSGTPRPTSAATPTPLPALLVNGDLPTTTSLVVELQEGQFALADLAIGALSRPFASPSYGSSARRAPDGSLYCICIELSNTIEGGNGTATIAFNRYDAAGVLLDSRELGEFSGQADPRDGFVPEQPEHVRASVTYTDDTRYAFVGWSAHTQPDWESGVIVVDVSTGDVLQRYRLPNATSGEGDTRRMTDAPQVVGAAGDRLIIGRHYYTWSPPSSTMANLRFDTDAYLAPFADGQFGTSSTLTAADGCGEYIEAAGGLPDGGLWLSCAAGYGTKIVRRIGADLVTSLGDISVPTVSDIDGQTTAASPDGKTLYLWHAVDLRLTRIDLASGSTDSIDGPKPVATKDILTALGRWLVPSAQAKLLLRGGIAVSADGSRVYALGVDRSIDREEGGSAGIYVVDTSGAMSVQRWDATADFVSIAVSNDGKYVYAAGMPGVDATGKRAPYLASVTVFEAASGDVRLMAGQLGGQLMTFPQALLQP